MKIAVQLQGHGLSNVQLIRAGDGGCLLEVLDALVSELTVATTRFVRSFAKVTLLNEGEFDRDVRQERLRSGKLTLRERSNAGGNTAEGHDEPTKNMPHHNSVSLMDDKYSVKM